jgi:ketosteroid isomerase-like protein
MAEHPNVTLIRETNERVRREGPEVMAEILAEDVVWHEIGRTEPRHGVAELQTAMEGGDFEIDWNVHDIVGDDDHVVLLADATATRGGRTLAYRVAEIYHLKDGRITERWAFSDDTQAIADFFA